MTNIKILPDIPEELLLEIYRDLAKPGVQQVGKALGGILSVLNLASLPFKLIDQKGTIWLEQNLEKYREKMSCIDPAKVHHALPEIAVPVIEKMAYTTCSELGEMFANLLKNASTTDGINKAHPNFVNIISSISRDEAIILEDIHKGKKSIPSLFLKRTYPNNIWNTPIMCFTHYNSDDRLSFPKNDEFYFNNLENLGVVYKSNASLSDSTYEQLEAKIQFVIESIKEDKGETYKTSKNHIGISALGKLFLESVFE